MLPFAGGYGKQLLDDGSRSGEDYNKFTDFKDSLKKLEKEGEKNNENFSVNVKDYGNLHK